MRLIDSTRIGVYEVRQHSVATQPAKPARVLKAMASITLCSLGLLGGRGWNTVIELGVGSAAVAGCALAAWGENPDGMTGCGAPFTGQ